MNPSPGLPRLPPDATRLRTKRSPQLPRSGDADLLFAFTASLANSLIASGAWARANSRSSPITGGGAPRDCHSAPFRTAFLLVARALLFFPNGSWVASLTP